MPATPMYRGVCGSALRPVPCPLSPRIPWENTAPTRQRDDLTRLQLVGISLRIEGQNLAGRASILFGQVEEDVALFDGIGADLAERAFAHGDVDDLADLDLVWVGDVLAVRLDDGVESDVEEERVGGQRVSFLDDDEAGATGNAGRGRGGLRPEAGSVVG